MNNNNLELNSRSRYPTLAQEWAMGEQKQLVNFDPYIYAINPDRLDIMPEDVGKYFFECLMLSTLNTVTIDPEKGFLHTSGAAYNELFSRAIEHYSSNPEAIERFRAEWDGFKRAQQLIQVCAEEYGVLPPIVLASPPGKVYDVGMEHTKSVTYVGVPIGYDDQQRPNYKLYSVPTKELEVQKHWSVVEAVADVQTSLQLLSESMTEITPNTVVAMPVILESVESSLTMLAQLLGFPSWESIEIDVQASSLLDKEYDRTSMRRKAMINWSVAIIHKLVADGQSKPEFEALQETLRQVFAAERGSKYTDRRYEDVDQVILEMEQLFVGNGGDPRYARQFVVQEIQYQQAHWLNKDLSYEQSVYLLANNVRSAMLGWIGGNPLARDSYMGTACGRGGTSNLFDRWNVLDSNRYSREHMTNISNGLDIMQDSFSTTSTVLEYSSSNGDEPDGLHEGKIEYHPGTCAVCHQRRKKVGSCGYCTYCERKDAAGKD